YGGSGPPANVPQACEISTKLMPAAVTRIRTSPGPGLGTGASVIRRRSCGPFRDVWSRARMVRGVLIPLWFRSRTRVIEADLLTPGRTRRDRKRNRSGRLGPQVRHRGSRLSVACSWHVRPEPEHGDQSWVAKGGDPADARAGDGEHADSVRPVVPMLVAGVGRCGRLPVGAGGQHAPVTRRSQEGLAQECYAGLAAGEPGTQRRRLQGGVL